jgi:hypothetical protein
MSFKMLVPGEGLPTICTEDHVGVWIEGVVLEKAWLEMWFDSTEVDRDLLRGTWG